MGGDLLRDLKFSVRMLLKNPAFTAAAVLTLALGIGLNAATFSAVHALLLKPLPGATAPDELVQIYRRWGGIEFGSNSIPHYQDVRDRSGDVFADVAAWFFGPMSITSDDRPERVIGMLVSANFFQTYGAEPHLGRGFIPGEEDVGPGGHAIAVLGHSFWRSRFAEDPGVVGRTVTLNGLPFEIVGVAPPDFRGPVSFADPPIYVPLMMQQEIIPGHNLIDARGNNMMNVIGRLGDGVSAEQAQQALDAMLIGLREEHPSDYANQLGTTLVPQSRAGIHPSFADAQLGMSAVMMVVVGLLLLIACVNVANLFLARARERRREIGIRLSLGAGRKRIIRQLLTESFLFATVSGGAGLALAGLSSRMLARFRMPFDGPWAFDVSIDRSVLFFTLGVSMLAGLLFGLVPALQAARPETVSAIKGESDAKGGRSRASSALVVAQVALSLLLLVGSGLFLRSLQGATRIDPGFEQPASLALAAADPALQGYEEARTREFWDLVLQSLSADPAITEVGLTDALPLGLNSSDRGVMIPGYEFTEGERRSIPYAVVSEGYLEALGVRLLEGRFFDRGDDADAAPTIVLNRRMADRFWPGESALGKIVTTAGLDREVVGVVETGKYNSLGEEPTEFMYLPHRELFRASMTVVARTAGDASVGLQRIQETLRGLDPDLPMYDVRTMENHMGIALLPARLGGTMLGVFGLLGMLLAAIGVYGVMAYSVAQRTRELGIRIALGASRGVVLRLVLGEGMRLAVLGAGIGLVGAFAASRLVRGLLYGAEGFDPVAFIGVPILLLVVSALAIYIPARRAASVEPVRALKYD